MIITIELTDEEKRLADAYAKINRLSLSEAMKRAFFDKIEDEYDIVLAESAEKQLNKNPKTYSLKEVMNELEKRVSTSED